MRATVMYGAGDVRVETVPDPVLHEPTDAIVRVVQSCICGSDLWPYGSMPATGQGRRMGHEFLGIVEDTGADVAGLARGDLVVAPFVWADNTCDFCRQGLHTSCRHGGGWGSPGVDAGQGEAVRVPQAQGTLVKLPVAADSALLPSLLTLSDVFCTGHHAAVTAGVNARTTVTVVGDGAVGLSAVLAANRLGAERIILMGRHKDRTDLGREFGATDVVDQRGDEGVALVRELTGGDGTHTVLECVGTQDAIDVLEGRIEPGRVFDRTIGLDDVPDGYRSMAGREALKVLIRP
jgi:threonine dehydrogenase-like Zn-dependent dehydrogenase